MPGTCVVGLQWGDEAKGKIVDLLGDAFDLVVRYNGGANAGTNRLSGSQSAVATFALAAGDTNPQDIADPPPAGLMQSIVPSSSMAAGDNAPGTGTNRLHSPGQTNFGAWNDGVFMFLPNDSDLADDDASGAIAGFGNSHSRSRSKTNRG